MIDFGTCSWNYDSWVGPVYSRKQSRSAEYLREYAGRFRTVEVDSWFYRMPAPEDAAEYLSFVDPAFTFSCKLTESITLTHGRGRAEPNPDFLSPELFGRYASAAAALGPQLFAIEMEFEYLNREKMPSLDSFLGALETFLSRIDRKLPLAVETRNANYLKEEYFQFLKKHNLAHVFSEKIYMPPIVEVYARFGHLLSDRVVVRLLGGDRKAMETKTGNRWDALVEEKPDLPKLVDMFKEIDASGRLLNVYVNNHYEGSAPLTIDKIRRIMGQT